ncbi:hypothetical protein Slin15195_G125510 [Septoria linicola]|uniref:Uncharacterized protein n=1 Tax=Septoria linicola TaxID=215465 RepID=A0A9Q9B8G7_9PEZI|nr:hypothetical protein Slin14017_G081700 [Septoria linicola]USW59232.1 hypothetical protein Slin15195_G125510 [Septoria linicola]
MPKGRKRDGLPRRIGVRHEWSREEYMALYLLYTQWQFNPTDINAKTAHEHKLAVSKLSTALFPGFRCPAKKKRSQHLWKTFNDRKQSLKPQGLKDLDRPNNHSSARYSLQELELYTRLKDRIEYEASEQGIHLIDGESIYTVLWRPLHERQPWSYCRDEDKGAVAAMLQAIRDHTITPDAQAPADTAAYWRDLMNKSESQHLRTRVETRNALHRFEWSASLHPELDFSAGTACSSA